MADDDQLGDWNRPGFNQVFQDVGEFFAIGANMAATVVMQINSRVGSIPRQRCAVIVRGAVIGAFTIPLQIIHAQTMHQHQQLAALSPLQHQRLALLTKLHRDRKWVVGGGEIITKHTIECGRHGFVLRKFSRAIEVRRELFKRQIETRADSLCDAANATVDHARDAAG